MPVASRKTIIGLVDAGGSAGVSSGSSNGWNLVFRLVGWRHPGSPVETGERHCALPVPKRNLEALMESVKAYSIIEAEIDDQPSPGTTRLRRLVVTDVKDPELEQLARELQKPIVLADPILGQLEYDRKYECFSGRAEWCGQVVEISLSCDRPEKPATVLEAASRLFADQSDWHHRVKQYAVEQLLPLKNRAWLDEREVELSEDEFLSRMTLQSIDLNESGEFTFWHDDGDLFWGHAIQISGSFSEGLTIADIPG